MLVFASMFVVLFILLFLGVPVAMSMIGTSLFVLGIFRGFADIPLTVVAQRLVYGVNNFTLLAIPSFLLIGKLMNSGGITDRIFNIASKGVGHMKGGMGHVNIVASMIFAGMSGSAVADAGGLGLIEIKAMKDEGYPNEFSCAVTAASATIGPIIPPSIPAVIYGALAQTSIAAIFLGSMIPGVFMGLSMMVLVSVLSHRRNYPSRERAPFKEIFAAMVKGFLPMLTPLIILVGIMSGVFTPTEAGAVALAYAAIIVFAVYREMSFKQFLQILKETAFDTAALLFIIGASSLFGWVLSRYQVTQGFITFINTYIQSPIVLLLVLNLFLFLIGFFIDSVPALFLLTPVLVPLVITYGIDPVHFGVIMIFNLMIGLVTPPVGTVLFTVQRVGGVKFGALMKEMLPFYIPLLFVLIVITYVPQIVMWLPGIFLG